MKLPLVLLFLCLALATESYAQSPPALHGGIRLKASFENGKPEAELAPGLKMLSRVYQTPNHNKPPGDGARNKRHDFNSLLDEGHESKYSFATATNANLRVLGAFNLNSGTVAGWFRKSDVFENGGLLLTAEAFPTSGRSTWSGIISWALGVGGTPGFEVPERTLFLIANGVQTIAATPLPDDEWVHLVATWDTGHGAKLYLNGELVANHWSDKIPTQFDEDNATPALFPEKDLVEELSQWTALSRTYDDAITGKLMKEGAFPDVKVSSIPSPKDGKQAFLIENSIDDRFQIRSPKFPAFGKGLYRISIRARRQNDESRGGGKALSAAVALTRHNQATSESINLSPLKSREAGEYRLEESLVLEDGDRFSVKLDFYGSGNYILEEFSIRPVPERGASQTSEHLEATLKSPDGTNPHVSSSLTYPADRLHLRPTVDGAIDDLVICDFPVNAAGATALFKGESPTDTQTEAVSIDRLGILSNLGWDNAQPEEFISLPSGQALHLKQATITEAKQNLKQAGWIAVDGFPLSKAPWWYKGYTFLPTEIRLDFENAFPINYISTTVADDSRFEFDLTDEKNREVLKLKSAKTLAHYFLDETLESKRVTLHPRSGKLTQIDFYSVSTGAEKPTKNGLSFQLSPAVEEVPLTGAKRDEFISGYRPRDRQTLLGSAKAPESAKPLTLAPFQMLHIISPSMSEEFALGSLNLSLKGESPSQQARLRLVVHDPITPWRELSRLDFRLEKEDTSFDLSLDLDLRDTLIRKGDHLWLSLICEEALTITSGSGGSALTLHPAADRDHAAELWRAWEMNTVRTRIEMLSEPSAWGSAGASRESSAWLAVTTPQYEYLDTSLRILLERFPDDAVLKSWFNFTHPYGPPNPAQEIVVPEDKAHPRWAFLLRENLLLYKEFIDWWTDHRLAPNGEWGNIYGDDTDLLQDWPDLALISDLDGRVADSFMLTADAVWNDFTLPSGQRRGEPIITDGLNTRWTDILHAYEEGLNIQPQAFQLKYGDPEYLSRLLATARRYDNFMLTPAEDGKRYFASGEAIIDRKLRSVAYISSRQRPKGISTAPYWDLMTHPGLVVAWYNRHPATTKILEELGNGMMELEQAGSQVYYGLYRITGKEDYLAPLIDLEKRAQGELEPLVERTTTFDLYKQDLGIDPVKAVTWLQHNDRVTSGNQWAKANRYDTHGSILNGFGDTRFERNWAEWYLSRDKSHLEEGLEQLYRKTKFLMPALTVAEQSADRVAVSKQLISRCYLGGVASSRNQVFYPDYALSYENFSTDFAALVTDTRADTLQVSFYNFEKEPQMGAMKTWTLDPGVYKLTAGFDRDGDDIMDEVALTERHKLVRGDKIPLTLPSQETWVVKLKQIEKTTPLMERVDAGISAKYLRQEGKALHVPIFNTGSYPIDKLKVQLRSADGKITHEEILTNLPVNDGEESWTLASKEVQFTLDPTITSWIIELDPEEELEEITRNNNVISFQSEAPKSRS